MIGKVAKYNVYMAIKSKMMLIESIILIGVALYTFYISIGNTLSRSGGFGNAFKMLQLRITFQTMGIMIPLAIIGFFAEFVFQEFLANEKMKGRFEFLIANGIPLKDLWMGTSLGISAMSLFILFVIYPLVLFLVYIFTKSSFYNSYFLILWFVIFPLLAIAVSFLISILGFIIKRVKLFEGVLMGFVLLLFFSGSFIMNHILLKGSKTGNIVTPALIRIFLVVILGTMVLTFFLKKRLTVDNVTLSIPD